MLEKGGGVALAKKYNFYFDEKIIEEFYTKRIQLKKLQEEVDEMSKAIKSKLDEKGMFYSSTENYNIYIEPCHKPTEKFIKLLKDINRTDLIRESCAMRDVEKICSEMKLDKNLYSVFWFDKLYVDKKHKKK